MIRIDCLSFEFAMNDESFAYSLYADWNNFSRICVEYILEECLSEYDKERVLHEIETIDLDLGSMPQEDFYSEFPARLRKELLKALPHLPLGHTYSESVKTVDSQFANLLYYLEQGVLKTEWADTDFNLSEELDELMMLDKRYMEKIAGLCMANEHVLRRILLQTDNNEALVYLYSIAMGQSFSVKEEKRRFMEIFLEMQPYLPVRFVHEVEEDGRLRGMAELLDTRSVRRMMEKEAEEHAEVGLPPYWHYLSEWLIKYYPFNGLALFGGKSDFIGHLHYRLLTFIRKRNNMFYLSKTELTTSFLLEVFGAAYYKEVLNAIYNMQPRNADGSPVYDGYYNRELYRVFIQLSLLYTPETPGNVVDVNLPKKETDSLLVDFRMEDLSSILKDVGRSDADKRMVVAALVQEKPEDFISWLKTEAANAATLITILASLIDEKILKQLLVSISLVAMEAVDEVLRSLIDLVREGRLLGELIHESSTLAARKAVLLWIKGNGYALSVNEGTKSLLQLIHKETTDITGKDNETTVEKWAEGLHLLENETEVLETFVEQESDTIKEGIRRLGMLLKAGNVAEAVKRRMVVSFLERYQARIADVIGELHEQGLLENAIRRVSVSAAEAIIKQMIIRSIGTGEAEKLLLLIDQLFADENTISAYLQDKSLTLKTQVLAWLAKEVKAQLGIEKPLIELFSLLLTALFRKEKMSTVIRLILNGMTREITTGEKQDDDILKVMELLFDTGSSRVHPIMSLFEQWSQQIQKHSNTVQTLLQQQWHTADNFMEWLEDTEMATESKRELLQALAREKPQELTVILSNLSQGERTVSLMATYISTEVLLDVVEKAETKQALLLSRTIDLLQRERGRFSFFSNIFLSFTTALSEAFLLFIQDNDTLGGRNLTEQEVIGKFLSCLYYVYTRRTDYNDNKEWKRLQDEVMNGIGLNGTDTTSVPVSENAVFERLLSEYGRLNDLELYHHIAIALDKQPGVFIELSEKNLDTEFIKRISGIADRAMLKRMVMVLSSVSGFGNHTAFTRLMEWLDIQSVDCITVSDIMAALLSWISTTDWERQSIRQMTLFFISCLYGSDDTTNLPLEMLTDDTLPEELRKPLLRNYVRSRPKELLSHIQRLAAEGRLPMDKWVEWTDLSEWLQLVASISLSLEELLRQVIEYLLSKGGLMNETVLKQGLLTFIATNDATRFTYYINKGEVVNLFLLLLPDIHERTKKEEQKMKDQMMENLGITPEEEKMLESSQENNQEIAFVSNAGLCLLTPWFPRLFSMLGYLDEARRDFKDTVSRIRAVFVLQYLVCPEVKDYQESELFFNRLLVGLPAHIPLPKQIELTDEEKQTVDSLLKGVKSNWEKMRNTSVNGFIQNFIVRKGELEQQDENWLLTVEERSFDVLLDSVPWSFRQIRYPWVKKYIRVFWKEGSEF